MGIWGIGLGLLCAHGLPPLYQKYGGAGQQNTRLSSGDQCQENRYGLFSWEVVDVLANPYCVWFALNAEFELLKDHILFYLVTNGGTNCLGHLYHAPAGSDTRSVSNVYGTVTKRLAELNKEHRS